MHWGNEYKHEPTNYQKKLAQLLCDGGADLIIGTHPHVLQPVEWLENEAGGRTLCVYSLGNFISGQHKSPTMLGGIFDMTLVFEEDGTLVETESAGVIPTVTHYDADGYAVYPLSQYTEELAAKHGIKKYEKAMTLAYLEELTDSVLGEWRTDWTDEP
jgi:poly-gamma-glutamate synthesis protein (capsule biosynthesis protein)